MFTKRKAATGAIRDGSLNQLNHVMGELTVSAFNNAGNYVKNQCVPQGSQNRFVSPRRCSFCNDKYLEDGSVAFVGVTVCTSCLRDNSTADFRELLALEREIYKKKFAGDLR